MINNEDNQDCTRKPQMHLGSPNRCCQGILDLSELSLQFCHHLKGSVKASRITSFNAFQHANICNIFQTNSNNLHFSWTIQTCASMAFTQVQHNAFSRLEMSLVLAFIAASAMVKSRSVFSRLPWPTTLGFRTVGEGKCFGISLQYPIHHPIKLYPNLHHDNDNSWQFHFFNHCCNQFTSIWTWHVSSCCNCSPHSCSMRVLSWNHRANLSK